MLMMPFSGKVVQEADSAPIEGVELCIWTHPELPCASSDASGNFSLVMPANWETGLTAVKPGYARIAVPFLTATHDAFDWVVRMPTAETLTTYYGAAGYTYPDMAKGFVIVHATDGQSPDGLEGVAFGIGPASDSGPLYAAPNEVFDQSLTATSTAGYARFAGTQPGELTVTVLSGAPSCNFGVVEGDGGGADVALSGGWPSLKVEGMRLPALAGFETQFGFMCD